MYIYIYIIHNIYNHTYIYIYIYPGRAASPDARRASADAADGTGLRWRALARHAYMCMQVYVCRQMCTCILM